MDAVALEILTRELEADRVVLSDAIRNASPWIEQPAPGRLQACAYVMNRFYTLFERMLERICESFENHFQKSGNYHEKLLQRLGLDLPGLRPAFLPAAALRELTELRRFRHLVRHAYDLVLRPDRLRELVEMATRANVALPEWADAFEKTVRERQGWAGST